MPHFRVDDGLHNHPKARKAGLEAMGLWGVCGSYCTGYGTDGFVPEWYVKTWPKGAALAKRLVEARLWHPAEHDGEKGWQFHEFVGPGRNDSRAQVEADREKWRQKKARQRGASPAMSPAMSPGDSRESPTYTQPNPTENSGYVPESATDSNGRDAIAATPGADLVRRVIPRDHPGAIQTGLRMQASALIKAGTPPETVEAALQLWLTKSGVGPGVLPSLVSDVIKAGNRSQQPVNGLTPGESKVAGWAQLGSPNPMQEAIER